MAKVKPRPQRKRVHRVLELNTCLCGDIVYPELELRDLAVECNTAGCETQWYHLKCVSDGPLPQNWSCNACRSNVGGGKGGKGSKRARK
ncbi:hypothetical protein BDQ17DRAFT_1029899 [Cyathus striatus]|nr:hypothetical protein BDQ17DRAFT_1029899 [Cyathus striatus]